MCPLCLWFAFYILYIYLSTLHWIKRNKTSSGALLWKNYDGYCLIAASFLPSYTTACQQASQIVFYPFTVTSNDVRCPTKFVPVKTYALATEKCFLFFLLSWTEYNEKQILKLNVPFKNVFYCYYRNDIVSRAVVYTCNLSELLFCSVWVQDQKCLSSHCNVHPSL